MHYRVGLRVLLPGSFSSLRWFGRGPHENYPDRKASAVVGTHASKVSEQLTPYIRPGECGAKVDVRWLEVFGGGRKQPSEKEEEEEKEPRVQPEHVLPEAAVLFAVLSAERAEEGGEGRGPGNESERPASLACAGSHAEATGVSEGGGSGSGSGSVFTFSALPHLAEELAHAAHPEQLVTSRSLTAVSLDHRLMGAGGDDSWSACVHDEFLVRPGKFRFAFAIAPYWRGGGGAEDGDLDGQASARWRALREGSVGGVGPVMG